MKRPWISSFLALPLGLLLNGCNKEQAVDATKIGQTVGKNVTQFAQGVGAGVDNQLQVEIELSQRLTEAGLSHTVAKQQGSLDNKSKSISIYLISKSPLETQLIAKAYNAQNQEIGRATTDAKFAQDDAQYVTFAFPVEMDRQLVTKYSIDSRAGL